MISNALYHLHVRDEIHKKNHTGITREYLGLGLAKEWYLFLAGLTTSTPNTFQLQHACPSSLKAAMFWYISGWMELTMKIKRGQ